MLKRVTKKHIEELANIIIAEGYWSEQVKEYLSKFTYDAMQRLDEKAKAKVRELRQNNTEVIEIIEGSAAETTPEVVLEDNDNITKVWSACVMIHNNKNQKTVAIDREYNVYICNKGEYDNNGNMKNAIKVSNNKAIYYLLTSAYDVELMKELFSDEDIQELKNIIKQYNIYIEALAEVTEEIAPDTEFIIIDCGEYKKVTVAGTIEIKGVKWYTIKESNNIYQLDYIKGQLERNEELNNKLNKQVERKKALELEELAETEKQQKELKEYNNDYGFTSNKSALQKGKILKQLNSIMTYNNEVITAKKVIELITSKNGSFTKSFYNTNRYSKKKIDGEYVKLVDKMEYRLYINNETFIDINKTLFDYANYLLELNRVA